MPSTNNNNTVKRIDKQVTRIQQHHEQQQTLQTISIKIADNE
ncbi:hypothetical protein [Chlorobium sp. KB01]|nr:hypothetical protein [Chlorobium sp. KB01]